MRSIKIGLLCHFSFKIIGDEKFDQVNRGEECCRSVFSSLGHELDVKSSFLHHQVLRTTEIPQHREMYLLIEWEMLAKNCYHFQCLDLDLTDSFHSILHHTSFTSTSSSTEVPRSTSLFIK